MQESDALLLLNLKSYRFELQSNSFSQLINTQLFNVCIQFLQLVGQQTNHIKPYLKQKFKGCTKLSQELSKCLGYTVQIRTLLTPNQNQIRRLIVSFISSLSSSQEKDKNIKKKDILFANWIKQEWIHEELQEKKFEFMEKQPNYSLNVDFLEKKDLSNQLFTFQLRSNLLPILSKQLLKKSGKTELSTKQTLKTKVLEKNKKKIYNSNRLEWNNLSIKKLNKIAEQIKVQIQVEQKDKTHFLQLVQLEKQKIEKKQIQIQRKVKTKESNKEQLNIQKIKDLHQNEIKSYIEQIQIMKIEIDKYVQKKFHIQEQINDKKQKIKQLGSKCIQIKKQAEKKQIIIDNIQDSTDLYTQINKLQIQIQQLQKQQKQYISSLEQQLKSYKNVRKQRIEIITNLKQKLENIQNKYQDVNQDIKYKQYIRQNIKINQKGLPRIVFNKRISQTEIRWKQGKKEIINTQYEKKLLIQKIEVDIKILQRLQLQIENMMSSDPKKKNDINKIILNHYNNYKNTMRKTIDNLFEAAVKKKQGRQIQSKLVQMFNKNYTTNIEKIKCAIKQAKQQNKQLQLKIK